MLANRIVKLLPIGLLLTACASGGNQTASNDQQFQPADMNGNSPAFASGYSALKGGNNSTALQNFQVSYNNAPSDPYEALDLGAAYQNSGMVDRALPLYRTTINNGQGVYPADVTQPEVQGMSLDEIAKHNLQLAGYDANGNRLQTAAAVMPAPAASTMSYQVFFDFDKSDISPEAHKILHQAALDAQKNGSVRIRLIGHTDTSGTQQYNQGLSERRAASAERALASEGISSNEISTRGVGENGLLVPTADGIKEPRNRRVEIIEEQTPNS